MSKREVHKKGNNGFARLQCYAMPKPLFQVMLTDVRPTDAQDGGQSGSAAY
jgi:hypothetical protein